MGPQTCQFLQRNVCQGRRVGGGGGGGGGSRGSNEPPLEVNNGKAEQFHEMYHGRAVGSPVLTGSHAYQV